MKYALITDTHFGARSDSLSFDKFFRKFYEETFFPCLVKEGITTIFHLGDCFDRRKYVNFNTLNSCREYFFDKAKTLGIDLVMIVGNHDTFYKNTNDVNSPGLLLKDYNNVTVHTGPVEYDADGTSILLMPWICTDNYSECMEAMNNTKATVMFGHFEIAGFQMYKGHENNEGFDPRIFDKFDLVCSGHFHHRSTSGNITYLGNPYELTWSDFEDPRGFHIFDSVTRELEFVQNPNTIFSKIYYDDTDTTRVFTAEEFADKHVKLVIVNKEKIYEFDKFLERVQTYNPLELKIIEDLSEFESDILDDGQVQLDDTVTLLTQYVDSLETDSDKERIKTLMKTLYVEAQNYEDA